MAQFFKLDVAGGGVYISKAGQSANAGSSPDAPRLTVMDMANTGGSTNVVGTGAYVWPSYAVSYERGFDNVRCDGYVKFLGNSTEQQALGFSATTFFDAYFDGFFGFVFRGYAVSNACVYNRCIFKIIASRANTPNSASVTNSQFNDCIFFNVNFSANGTTTIGYGSPNDSTMTFNRCIFINCTMGSAVSEINNSYIDQTSSLQALSAVNNNVDPRCNTAAGFGLNVNGGGFNLTSPGGISSLPGFNSVAKEDFTLQKDSPHLAKAIGPSYLRYSNTFFVSFSGGTGDAATASNITLNASASAAVVPLSSITSSPNGLEVNNQGGLVLRPSSASDGTGSFVSGRLPFADISQKMTVMRPIFGANFNADFPATEANFNPNNPEVFNNNVPDYSGSQPGSAGRNPNRMTYRLRWSTKLDPDLNNPDDWVSGASMIEFEWFTQPLWNQATAIGNGNPAFVAAGANEVFCRWYQIEVRLRNNYYR